MIISYSLEIFTFMPFVLFGGKLFGHLCKCFHFQQIFVYKM